MDKLFHVMDDAYAVLCSRGVYRQSKMYRRYSTDRGVHYLYAAYGSGFVQILASDGTSHPHVRVADTDVGDYAIAYDTLGRPYIENIERS